MLGYVWTDYGGEPTSTVEAEVNQWKSFYGVTSIFFDGASVNQGEESYYQTISAYVHETSGSVVELNPGSVPAQGYMDFGDVIDVFEGSASEYESFTMPSWATAYPASDFANIVYGVSNESGMATALARAQFLGTGYVYITDGNLPNPYSSLPSYWSYETELVDQACGLSG